MNINIYSDDFYGHSREARGERSDCTVAAVAAAFGTTYEHAHDHMRVKCNRPHGQGVVFDLAFENSVPKGVIERTGYKIYGNNITVGRFAKENPKGRFILLVRGHTLAVIDGEIHDHSYKPRRHVRVAYEVIGDLPKVEE